MHATSTCAASHLVRNLVERCAVRRGCVVISRRPFAAEARHVRLHLRQRGHRRALGRHHRRRRGARQRQRRRQRRRVGCESASAGVRPCCARHAALRAHTRNAAPRGHPEAHLATLPVTRCPAAATCEAQSCRRPKGCLRRRTRGASGALRRLARARRAAARRGATQASRNHARRTRSSRQRGETLTCLRAGAPTWRRRPRPPGAAGANACRTRSGGAEHVCAGGARLTGAAACTGNAASFWRPTLRCRHHGRYMDALPGQEADAETQADTRSAVMHSLHCDG